MQAKFLWRKKRNDLEKVLYFTERKRKREGNSKGAEENLGLEAEYKWPLEHQAQHYMTVMTAAPSPAFNENDI